MGKGAEIVTDAGASVSFNGQTVSLLGSVTAPGGTISVAGSNSFPVAPDGQPNVTAAQPLSALDTCPAANTLLPAAMPVSTTPST